VCEHELTAQEMEQLARAIYGEICRQFDADGPCVPQICDGSGMRGVIIEGEIDLIRLASTLAKRFCIRIPEIETVGDLNLDVTTEPRARQAI
jgi:hypothetical protein